MPLLEGVVLQLTLLATHSGAISPPSAQSGAASSNAEVGSIRGTILDRDFGVPLAGADVLVLETGQKAKTGASGTFLLPEVAPGVYTVVVSKEGYVRVIRLDVAVPPNGLADLSIALPGDIAELEEFVVEDLLQATAGSETALIELRLDSPALLDSIGSELMSKAGAGDAASALRLVAGASVADGKTAVIRGLPDRYVSSQLNGVRLPSADEDKRAVELDQFPSAVIQDIQVSKTFTPDQQGDASGGAVNVRLKGVPDETVFQLKFQSGGNSQVFRRDDFLTYDGGGITAWGDDRSRDRQLDLLGQHWAGASGTSEETAPYDWKLAASAGTKWQVSDDWKLGAFVTLFYERDSAYFDNGRDDSWWVEQPGGPLVPESNQGTPSDGDFKTALLDVTQGSQLVQWGGLGTLGLESEHHQFLLSYLYSRTAEDVATLATDTRGKEYFFPGYDPYDITDPGNEPANRNAAPYLRLETLEYTERMTDSLQLRGEHDLPIDRTDLGVVTLLPPEFDWTLSHNRSELDQPDKRQFGALWLPDTLNPGFPPFLPPFISPMEWFPYKPSANFTLGNFQRIWKLIEEEGDQASLNLKLPFEQWSGVEGYAKLGFFDDSVERDFDQDTFSNFNDNTSFPGDFDDPWSGEFDDENHPITASLFDVDYHGEQDVSALYWMADLPLRKGLNLIGGVRHESTQIGSATWFPEGAIGPVKLNPGDGDVDFSDRNSLPALAVDWRPVDEVILRGSWSRTLARQTFKEMVPILQQEYLGGPIFIGNPELRMSELENWDLRADWTPMPSTLLSASWFLKHIEDPIEYVQRVVSFTFTTARNYPEGRMKGWEFEFRQGLGDLYAPLDGISVGANATLIDSQVDLPADEIAGFALPNIDVALTSRDMTNAPEHLYNLYATWITPWWGTQLGLFWTEQGDTLVAGATESNGNFVPHIYAESFATVNATLTQPLGEHLKLVLQANNLTNPTIREVYRSSVTKERTRSSYTRGVDWAIALAAEFRF
jgi:hypothetical protein